MKIFLLDAPSTARRLSSLIEKHERISMAVAWGGITPVADRLLANRAKFESVILGVDFSATDPDLIDRLVDIPNAFVAKNRPGCFHPKVFYFESSAEAEAIVGSANFTKGGLGGNIEASIHVKGAPSDSFFAQVRDQLNSYKYLRIPITRALADGYRRQFQAAENATYRNNPVLPSEHKRWSCLNSTLGIMSWREFVRRARKDVNHHFEERMKLMRAVHQLFSKADSFANLSNAEAKGIAGVLGQVEAMSAGIDDLNWGWFGSMGGAGTFAELVGARDLDLAGALDGVPMRGNVTEAHFDEYIAAFQAAFSGASRVARLAPATRLLAMKRPDVFVCVNSGNITGLAAALSFAPTTINLENYWQRVIEPIRQSPWFNAPRPTGRDLGLWEVRVAMLDAIYYSP